MSCEVEELLEVSKCYLDPCMSPAERDAVEIYLLTLSVAALGGETYTPASLQVATKAWQGLSQKQLSAINTYISTNGAFNSNASIDDIKAAAACYMCMGEVTRHQLLTFLKCEMNEFPVSFLLTGYDGYDPILGSPYPPVNFQAYIYPTNPRLRWSLPNLLVAIETILSIPIPVEKNVISNYDSGDTVASQSGTTVTLAGGNLRFVDTSSDVGRKIRWSNLGPNTGEVATIVTVANATTAVVSENQTVSAGRFSYTPPGVVFKLYVFENGAFTLKATSPNNENGYHFEWYYIGSDFVDTFSPMWWHIFDPEVAVPTAAYVTAEANGITISSLTFSINAPAFE